MNEGETLFPTAYIKLFKACLMCINNKNIFSTYLFIKMIKAPFVTPLNMP